MTLPANIRLNVKANFPAQVLGAGFISVTKASGIWTIKADYTLLGPLLTTADLLSSEVVIYDPITKQYSTIGVAQLLSGFTVSYRVVTAAGDVTVGATDSTILLNKTVGAATNINLPTSASRSGLPVTVKDYKGDANTNNITFVPAAGETIDGFSAAAAAANGAALININYGKKTLFPLSTGGWYL